MFIYSYNFESRHWFNISYNSEGSGTGTLHKAGRECVLSIHTAGCYVTAMSLHFHRLGINTSKPMSIKSKSGNTGKFHFKAVCMIAFGIDSLLVKQNIFNSLMPVLSLC